MTANQTMTPVLKHEWTRSTATVPAAIAPHPPRPHGGWSHRQPAAVAGAGRVPLAEPAPRSAGLAFALGVLFGPLGLCYLSMTAGLVATALTAVVLLVAGAGFVPLLVVWPLAVLGSVWGADHVQVSG